MQFRVKDLMVDVGPEFVAKAGLAAKRMLKAKACKCTHVTCGCTHCTDQCSIDQELQLNTADALRMYKRLEGQLGRALTALKKRRVVLARQKPARSKQLSRKSRA